jgi:hypothetical protein
MSDIWRYHIAQNDLTHLTTGSADGVYGTAGVASVSNVMPRNYAMASACSSINGHCYSFGGVAASKDKRN